VDKVQPNSILSLDVEIVVATRSQDSNFSIVAIVDDATQRYLTVTWPAL
jgi:hypothetical protein